MNRRQWISSAGAAVGVAAAWNSLLAPVKAIAAELKVVRIKNVENFQFLIPVSGAEAEAGVMSRIGVNTVSLLVSLCQPIHD